MIDSREFDKCGIARSVRLSTLTTIKMGGVGLVVSVKNIRGLKLAIKICKRNNYKYFILGNGSNTVCGDNLSGIVFIKIGKQMSKIRKRRGDSVVCYAGALTSSLGRFCLDNKLSGVEFLSTIPASVGGAVAMNAGCFDCQVADVVATVYATDGYKNYKYNNIKAQFGYRRSVFKSNNQVITKVVFKLRLGESQQILAKTKLMRDKKSATQPLNKNSAGSVFLKCGDVAVSKLIDQQGFKGFCVGDLQVSTLHAGFIINVGNATLKDFVVLIDIIKQKIYNEYNIQLTSEVVIIGEY